MLSESDIEAAHPEAFDFAFGNLPAAKRAEFDRHLTSCRYCRAVVDEYSEIGQVIKSLPPHVEPPADLEDRTVAAMVTALCEQREDPARRIDAQDQATTRLYPVPRPPAEAVTQVQPRPQFQPPAETTARTMVTRLPVWRRYRGRLAAVAAVAAAIIVAAIIIPLSMGGPTGISLAIPLHATTTAKLEGYGAATGQATARQDASGSWKISLTVAHLKSFGDSQWYQCWYVSRHGQVASAGTFQVPNGGTWTLPMTSAVDPRDFRTMEITLGPPTETGAFGGPVILSGQVQ
jgi:anti-sigma-K factor RskA